MARWKITSIYIYIFLIYTYILYTFQARHLKTAALPVMGATIGFAAGGPIGAVAGVRIGLVVSVVGSAAGYFGGKFIHKVNRFVPPTPRPHTE